MLRAAPHRLLPFGLLLALSTCYVESTAYTVRTNTPPAYAEVAGVRIWAQSEWSGSPPRLWDTLSPVKVTLENHSGRPLRVGYREFSLVGASGFHYSALPPFPVQAPVSDVARPEVRFAVASGGEGATPEVLLVAEQVHGAQPVQPGPGAGAGHAGPGPGHAGPPPGAVHGARPVSPGYSGHVGRPMGPVHPYYHGSHFAVAPYYAPYWPLFSTWPYAWAASDLAWYDRTYRTWPEQLPSEDMVNQALPEGVLDDGGTIAGLLYFQYAGRESATRLDLTLVDASSQQAIGTASLPVALLR